MTEVQNQTGFEVFTDLLKSLCLSEFPCGYGSWRAPPNYDKKTKQVLPDNPDLTFAVTTKDYGAEKERTETLEEYLHSEFSPWQVEFEWSEEALKLRDIAVKTPWLINETFILEFFKSLRLTSNEITDIDEKFRVFKNLQELQLGCNRLQAVNSRNLPENLQVLELCGNEISNLADLAIQPPPLTHLGLGCNKIHMLEDYISPDLWPNLRSLDLSFNNLGDLVDVVKKLQNLPKLKNLILLGNPLCLVPGYRGFTIDMLRALEYLDEKEVSVEDRTMFRGLARRRELVQDVVKLFLRIDHIKGMPPPEEIKNPDEQPEFPIVNRRYFVRFMFPEEKKVSEDLFTIIGGAKEDGKKAAVQTEDKSEEERYSERDRKSLKDGSLPASENGNTSQDKARKMSQQSGQSKASSKPVSTGTPRAEGDSSSVQSSQKSQKPKSKAKGKAGHGKKKAGQKQSSGIPLAPVDSEKVPWTEEMGIEWSHWISRTDVMGMKKFFQTGLDFAVMEEVSMTYPADQEAPTQMPPPTIPKPVKAEPPKKPDAKTNKQAKEEKKPNPHSAGHGGKEKKGKKGEPEVEMTTSTPEYHIITHFHLPLQRFLDGATDYHNLFVKKYLPGVGYVSPKQGYLSNPPPNKRPPEPKEESPEPPKGKKGQKKEKKGKTSPPPEGKSPLPPPKLEVHLAVYLHQWKNAMESVREDLIEYSDTDDEDEEVESSGDEYYEDLSDDDDEYRDDDDDEHTSLNRGADGTADDGNSSIRDEEA